MIAAVDMIDARDSVDLRVVAKRLRLRSDARHHIPSERSNVASAGELCCRSMRECE